MGFYFLDKICKHKVIKPELNQKNFTATLSNKHFSNSKKNKEILASKTLLRSLQTSKKKERVWGANPLPCLSFQTYQLLETEAPIYAEWTTPINERSGKSTHHMCPVLSIREFCLIYLFCFDFCSTLLNPRRK